jgi:hypothetical protein
MFRVLGEGDDRHRLEDAAGARIGWINGRAIGLRGLASESVAMRAAVAASHALETALRREYPGRPRQPLAVDELQIVHDGAYEWVADGARPLARLLRPMADVAPDHPDASYGIELVLPSYSTEGVAISSALTLARVVIGFAEAGVDAPPHALDAHAAPAGA